MTSLNELMTMSGRRVLITGAAGGLGRVFSESLAELGADLVLVDLPGAPLSEIALDLADRFGIHVDVESCDLEDGDARAALADSVLGKAAGLNVLINNAAFVGTSGLDGWATDFDNQSVETWRRAIEVNLTAPFHLSQLFAPALRQSTGASIINISSIYGEYGPDWSLYADTAMANPAAYAASKGGLAQLTRWLSTTLAPDVRVNAISPGGIERGQPEVFIDRYTSRTPLGRMANTTDFQGAVTYLASDLSAYVTGQILRVDGGWGTW